MKPQKNYLLSAILLFSISIITLNAQVGVGTTTPEGALDISSASAGFLLPRTNLMNTSDVTTVKNPQGGDPAEGTLIYDEGTNLSDGFYYFDGTKWNALMTADKDTYLGISDQTLTANRNINLSGYNLNIDIASSGSNGLSLDTDYLFLSRDAGNTDDGLISTRGGLAFNIDSDNGNSNDSEYFAWGQDAAPGSGTGDAAYDELMRLDATGLGIGTNKPDMKLHVVETTGDINVAKFESPEFPMFAGFIIEDTGGSNTARFAITPGNVANNSAGALSGVPASNANGKNCVTFDVEGSIYDIYTFMEGTIRPGFDNLTSLGAPNHRFTDLFLVNAPTVTSDVRLKENINDLDYGLDTVMQIETISYELIDDAEDDVHLGFKAQQIQELIPEVVTVAPESGKLSMAYSEMIPVLTKAIQDLNNKLDTVLKENKELKAQNTALLEEISGIK
jgi:hypothetical protein